MLKLLAALFCVVLASSAHADGRAFPPDNCTTGSPFMAFTGVDGSNTFCNSGQDIFKSALPNCAAGQQITYDGAQFTCENKPDVPACAADQVLTFTGNSYLCIKRTDTIPTCATGQYLTYNGSSYQCVSVQVPVIPTCADGQTLTGSNGHLVCTSSPAVADTRTMQDVTSNRAFGTTYTNATPNAIVAYVGFNASAPGNSVMICVIDGITLPNTSIWAPNSGYRGQQTLVVPSGSTYGCFEGGAAGATLYLWIELRP